MPPDISNCHNISTYLTRHLRYDRGRSYILKCTGKEERSLDAGLIKRVDEGGRVLVRAVIVRERKDPRLGTLVDDRAGDMRALHDLDRVWHGAGRDASREGEGSESRSEQHLVFLIMLTS
jgi:hypothetical protein